MIAPARPKVGDRKIGWRVLDKGSMRGGLKAAAPRSFQIEHVWVLPPDIEGSYSRGLLLKDQGWLPVNLDNVPHDYRANHRWVEGLGFGGSNTEAQAWSEYMLSVGHELGASEATLKNTVFLLKELEEFARSKWIEKQKNA